MKKPSASMPQRFRSSSRAHPAVPRSRRCRAINARARRIALAATIALLVPACALAATPAPTARPHAAASAPPKRIDLTKVQSKALLPKKAEHTEFVVEINKLGQVSRITSRKTSDNPTFNAQTYGNAQQAFIRTPDGHVVLGTYRLTYDFDPKTARVRRDVELIRQGGVDPDAKGVAADMIDRAHPAADQPNPAASINPRDLPDLNGILGPPPTPH